MSNRIRLFPTLVALLIASALAACGSDNEASGVPTADVAGATSVDAAASAAVLDDLPLQPLSESEKDSLAFMREEEKLAHDVYVHLDRTWGTASPTFDNIAASESTHTEAVRQLLERYDLPDPAAGRAEGDFEDPELQALHARLTLAGAASLVDALKVGVEIEELDIRDIQTAIDTIDNEDITLVYENLIKGSRNHLRAFHRALERAGGSYVPQFIDQEVFDAILAGELERG